MKKIQVKLHLENHKTHMKTTKPQGKSHVCSGFFLLGPQGHAIVGISSGISTNILTVWERKNLRSCDQNSLAVHEVGKLLQMRNQRKLIFARLLRMHLRAIEEVDPVQPCLQVVKIIQGIHEGVC